ncbi:hypothetical protein FRC10_011870 [Ceratobasidium sp. 414]|nr:hypothetical protein FRC10_011870 [Ceratobasidium sp. 414]
MTDGKDEDAENDKGYEPDTECEGGDEDKIGGTMHHNDEDGGFERGRRRYIKRATAARGGIERAPTGHTASTPSQTPLFLTRFFLPRPLPEFTTPFTTRPTLTPTSAFLAGFKLRRVKSAPTQLALLHSDLICATPPPLIAAIPIPADASTEGEKKLSNSVVISASAVTPTPEDNENDEEDVKDKEHEEVSGDNQVTSMDICAKIVVAAPSVPTEVIVDTPPITSAPTEVADENTESKPDSLVVSAIPAADIALPGEDEDEVKTRDEDTSEESSDDEEFINRMREMIEAAVPMAEPSRDRIYLSRDRI